MPGRLLIFCGIPGSGKTTIARAIAARAGHTAHLQTDAFRRMISSPDYSSEESAYVYDACISTARVALDAGYIVILDATFLTNRRREETLAALRGSFSRASVVQVICDFETALRRNAGRGKEDVVPEERLKDMAAAFEPPEGAIVVDTSDLLPEEAAEKVIVALGRT